MRPGWSGCPFRAWAAGKTPDLCKICGSKPGPSEAVWSTMSTGALRSLGSLRTNDISASTPPKEAPITTGRNSVLVLLCRFIARASGRSGPLSFILNGQEDHLCLFALTGDALARDDQAPRADLWKGGIDFDIF